MVDYQSFRHEVNSDFKTLLDNRYNYAFTSYNIQLFVLIMALVFLFIETIGYIIKIYSWKFNQSTYSAILTSVVIIFFGGLILGFLGSLLSGSFASDKIIDLYLKSVELRPLSFMGINVGAPPPTSPITKWRIAILIYGIIFAMWRKRISIVRTSKDEDNNQEIATDSN